IYDYYGATGVIDKVADFIFDGRFLLIGEDGANLISKVKNNAFIANGKYWVNNHAHVFADNGVASLDYLAHFINAISLEPYLTYSAQPKLTQGKLLSIFVPLPPLEEQRRIVAKLDDIMGNLERMDQAYTELSGPMVKHFKNLVLQQAISGQLVPQLDSEPAVEQIGSAPTKEEEPFALPKKWKWVRLKSLAAHIQYGYTASASDSGEVKLLRITDLHEGKVNWDSVPFCSISSADIAKFKLLPNDIVIARSGATVGKSFKVGQIEHEAVFASYLIRIGLNDKLPVSASYIKTYLDSPTYWHSIFQSARGTAMKNVNAQQLGALLIPLPPLEEQRRIVARIEELFGDVDKLLEWQQFA
ncbi:MAG TPA: restriction endonuclease subunit S, partial [Candidatus Anaerobiospirillum pullistercoris]|nr:restriction endonuclease subunit S [Candidatus Anaerobiospirillum pullistercoris]